MAMHPESQLTIPRAFEGVAKRDQPYLQGHLEAFWRLGKASWAGVGYVGPQAWLGDPR